LQGEGPFTLFAPTDEAFENLPTGTLDTLVANQALLERVLLYHIVPERLMAPDVAAVETLETVSGDALTVASQDDQILVNAGQVVTPNIEATNGVIHAVNTVLMPPGVEEIVLTDAISGLISGPDPVVGLEGDIAGIVLEGDRFTSLALALQTTGLADRLREEGPFTLFAPVEEAFQRLPEGSFENLLANPQMLGDILQYHVVPGRVTSADLAEADSVETLLGQPLVITQEDEVIMVGQARVLQADIEATNGLVHIIDTVLTPPESEAMAAEQMPAALEVSCSEDYQVQADDWLSKLAAKFYGDPLAYPALFEATNRMAQESDLYSTIEDPNRIEIGQTLCVPSVDLAEQLLVDDQPAAATTVGDLVGQTDRLTTLVDALQTATFTDTLQTEGPFTLFAPTNQAFENLPAGELDRLLANPLELRSVLLYHIVPDTLMAEDLRTMESLDTSLDQTLEVTVQDDSLMVNNAQVLEADLEAANGVIHLVDTVLLPPGE
jgi:transforming growth factor-beta-induced protein